MEIALRPGAQSFPQGGAQPNASMLNYVVNQTVAKGPSPRLVHLL